jgi:hypothetical protein
MSLKSWHQFYTAKKFILRIWHCMVKAHIYGEEGNNIVT